MNYIELKKEIAGYRSMKLWAAKAHYGGHITEGFALCPEEDGRGLGSCDFYESDPRELPDMDGGLRLLAYMPGHRPGNDNTKKKGDF